jgi:7-cyano-7-deazaguanine synthase in queuosine biosynthesis
MKIKKKTIVETLAQIQAAVFAAYYEPTRNLQFKAAGSMTIADAVKTMTLALDVKKATDEGYNDFRPSFFRLLPKGTLITLAREGSVCAYIELPEPITKEKQKELIERMSIDEWDVRADGSIRLWWD